MSEENKTSLGGACITPEFVQQIRVINAALLLNLPHELIANFSKQVNPWCGFGYETLSMPIGCLMVGVDEWPNREGFFKPDERKSYTIRMPDGRHIYMRADTKLQDECLAYLQGLADKASKAKAAKESGGRP